MSYSTEKPKRIDMTTVQNIATTATAAVSTPLRAGAGPDVFLRLSTTAAAYYNTVPVPAGTFTLNPAGAGSTAGISILGGAAAIQSALQTKLAAATATVTGLGSVDSPFIITFVGALGHAAQTLTKVDSGVTNAALTLTASVVGDGTHDAVYTLVVKPSPLATSAIGVVLPAGAVETIRVEPGTQVTTLRVTADGIFSIAVVDG